MLWPTATMGASKGAKKPLMNESLIYFLIYTLALQMKESWVENSLHYHLP